MTTTPHDPAKHLAEGFAELGQDQKHLGKMMDELQAAADSGDGGMTAERDSAAGDGEQCVGDQGGEDGFRTAGHAAGPRTPTAAELAALFDAGTAPEPTYGQPAPAPPTAQPAPPATDETTARLVPAGEGKAKGGPSPKRRMLQIVHLAAAAGGIGPTALHQALAVEGYPTNITTVQNTLRDWKAREYVQQTEERGPYVPGPKFPTERM